MESTSQAGRIQCSIVSAKLLRQQMPSLSLQPRGHVSIKGKGEMETVWVNEGDDDKSNKKAGAGEEWSEKYFDRLSRQMPSSEGVSDTSHSSSASSRNKAPLAVDHGNSGMSLGKETSSSGKGDPGVESLGV